MATENNNVYGLDPGGGTIDWGPINVGTPFRSADLGCTDLAPNIGITGTAAVDTATDTAYVVAKTETPGNINSSAFQMHSFNMATGAEDQIPGFPVTISGQASNGGATFDASTLMQRPGLLFMDGTVFAGFGGICDHPSYRGWVAAVPENGTAAGWSTPSTLWTSGELEANSEGAVWMSDAPIVSDGTDQLLITTGNSDGSKSTDPGPGPGADIPVGLASSVVRLAYNPGSHTMAATDFFSPYNNQWLSSQDLDVGSGGVLPLPCTTSCSSNVWGTATVPNVGITPSKNGSIYVLNRSFLGGQSQGPSGGDGVPQRIDTPQGYWNTFAPWPDVGPYVYIVSGTSPDAGGTGTLVAYQDSITGTAPTFTQAATAPGTFGYSSSSPIVTSNGTGAGTALVWDVYVSDASGDNAQLRAYDAVPSGSTLTLEKAFSLGTPGAKFARPYVNNNMVYVGTRGTVYGFG